MVSVAPVPDAAIKPPVVADPIALVSPVAEASVADPDGNEPGLVAVERAVPDVVYISVSVYPEVVYPIPSVDLAEAETGAVEPAVYHNRIDPAAEEPGSIDRVESAIDPVYLTKA